MRLGIDIETAGEAATALTRRAASNRSGQIHVRRRALSCPPVGSSYWPRVGIFVSAGGQFFMSADRVEKARKSRRKGTLPAYRDTTMFKVMYGWGLRINELCRLDVVDLLRNSHAPDLGQCGFLHVRYGKASKGSPPKRRTVPTLMPWAADALLDYVDHIRPLYEPGTKNAMWLTERGSQIKPRTLTDSFDEIRDKAGLDSKLTPHCFRHSFISHMIEDGVDSKFLQEIAGHRFASTTGIYTHVSGEFMNTMLTNALRRVATIGEANG